MKKFVIISIILLLIGGGAFGYSLYHYIEVTKPPETATATPSEAALPANNKTALPTQAEATEADAAAVTDVFAENTDKAKKAVEDMTKEEMAGQLVVGISSDTDTASADIAQYGLAGYLFEGDAFSYKTEDEIKEGLAKVRESAKISPIIAAEEEGGEKLTVSDNGSFSDKNFDSPRNLLASGGLQEVEKIELQKATFLQSLGFNVNLAPVVDMPNASDQIMYSRSLSEDVKVVSDFAKYCAKHVQAKGISITLKHFPGYGTIPDSANYEAQSNGTPVVDDRDADTIRKTDYTPFKTGAQEGAHFVMVSNVIVKNMDPNHTAALSPTIVRELRNVVGFKGLIITDVIDDSDYSAYADGKDVAVAAILAGDDLVLTRNYANSYNAILAAVNDGTISEDLLKETCTRVLAYKYTAGLLK